MKTSAALPKHAANRVAAASRSSAMPRFRMRLLTLAVLSACSSLTPAAQNQAAAPVNPLPTGGVVANPGTASIVNSAPNLMVINQTAPQTTIHWSTFDIGQGNTVRFNQPSASSEAMNYIGGANPSVIQGTLTANGKVYLVNGNGILFDGTAQVNVNTLIASSLDISQSTFDNGITSSLVGQKDPALVATMVLNTAGQVINYGTIRSVKVDGASGQVVNDPKTGKPVEEGGAIMLFAPQVENHGLITANNGQVILAAGGSVYLQLYNDPTGADYNPNDLSMRGFLVKVTAADEPLNLSQFVAENLNRASNIGGEIHSDRGNTTLTGLVVNQSGLVSANTAATVNGSIWLKAEKYDAASGQTTYDGTTLTTSKDSVTETLPEDDGTTLAEGSPYTDNSLYNSESFPHYQAEILMAGQTVDHEGSALAPGGRIEVGRPHVVYDDASRPSQPGRVYLGADSVLSVAGEWVDLPYSSNYLTFKLGSLDLADAPLQKGGFLINQTVTVDTRQPSPLLFDISGKIAGLPRSVLEKATTGGAITVNTGEFISATGSKVDVSGGGVRYGDGVSTATYLVSHGRLYDIATAPVNLQYDGVVTRNAPVRGYVQGASAGLLAIDAKQMVFGGSLAGGVTIGPYQRAAGALPSPGTLVLGTQSALAGSSLTYTTVQDGTVANDLDTLNAVYALKDVIFGPGPQTRKQIADALGAVEAEPLSAAFPDTLDGKVLLPTDLFGGTTYSNASATASSGFGSLAVRASGDIAVPQGVALDLGAGGSLLWLAPQIDVAGTIRSQGGSLVFNQNFDHSVYGTTHLAGSGALSVAGGWINDAYAGGRVVVPDLIDGGAVMIGGSNVLSGTATLDPGSQIDASGGALLSAAGKLSYGKGGSIALPTISLQGVSLQAYSGTTGGSLTLGANIIDVGGSGAASLLSDFFTEGGFALYTLQGGTQVNFGADIHPVSDPRLATASAALAPSGTPFADISSVSKSLPPYLRAPSSLAASTGSSTSTGYQLGADETGVTVAAGVTIATDPGGNIDLSSRTLMDIEGTLNAPGGKIALSLDPGAAPSPIYYDTTTGSFNVLRIGSQSLISAAGTFVPDVAASGRISGKVLPGGSVTITANKNDLIMAPGATIDVSGTAHVVDLQTGAGYTRTNVASEGGRIAITATENAYLDGTFKGSGGNASVAGGSFSLNTLYNGADPNANLTASLAPGGAVDPNVALEFFDAGSRQLQHVIVVSQSSTPLPHDGSAGDSSQLENLTDSTGNFAASLRANISADQLVNGVARGGSKVGGGFDSVTLNSDNQIVFDAGVENFAPRALLNLNAPELRVTTGGTAQVGTGSMGGASWQTGQLEWFNTPSSFRLSTYLPSSLIDQYPLLSNVAAQVPVATTTGAGGLTLAGGQISLAGYLTANGAANLELQSSGDVRFEGFPAPFIAQTSPTDANPLISNLQALTGGLTSSGNIALRANQIYPATSVDFTVAVNNVTVNGMSHRGTVVSANVSETPVSNGEISVFGNQAANFAPVLSAGGRLTLRADKIDQGGTIIAPLGTINLEGGESVTLESGSLTSVSAVWNDNGVATPLVIPFGATQSVGQSMWYGSLQTSSPPAKQIDINARTVTVAEADASTGKTAAIVDIQGGGDIAAMEFVPGIGGSNDALTAPGTYAIIPGVAFPAADSQLASMDPIGVKGTTAYNTVTLAAGSGLPAGNYALLPAYYALLPGAYLVKAQSGPAYDNMTPGQAATQNDGAVVVAGKLGLAGTAIAQSTWSGFSVQSGADALTNTPHAQGQYLVTGSQFFANQASNANLPAPAMPLDGGRLSIGATGNLGFQGNLLAQAGLNPSTGTPGAIGQVDIYGSQFAILGNGAVAPTGYSTLQANDLSLMEASLMIGGKRTDSSNGQSVDVVASDILVDLGGGTLTSPELYLVASDSIGVTGTSSLVASGTVVDRGGSLTINPDSNGSQYGALLGLSAGQLVSVVRAGTLDTGSGHGNLTVATGATLTATGGSIVVDSTGTPQVAGLLSSVSLEIGARQIALGAVPQTSTALALGSAQLAALTNARNFVLRSYSSIDLYGDVDLGQAGTGSFTFDSAGLIGHDVDGASAPVQVSARQITLENLSGSTQAVDAPGTGALTLNADTLVLADSSRNDAGFTVAGFSRVDLNAGEVSLQGKGSLTVASDLNIESARIAAGGAQADQQIQAYDAGQHTWHTIKVTQPASAPTLADAPLPGGKLQIDATSVDFDGNVALQSGRLTIAAHGPAAGDGIVLKDTASIDLSAYEKTFAQGSANLTESAAAGRLTLSSDNGSVDAQAGSTINLNGGAAGGDAGILTIAAANGTVALDGTLSAGAAAGQQSGSANIDAANLANFAALNAALETGGFGQSRYLRARSGTLDVAGTDTVTAHNVQLVADAGAISVEGIIDAHGAAGGGTVELDAGQGIHLAGSSRIQANGTSTDTAADAAYSDGGKVALYARGGPLAFDNGGVIDVSAAAAGKSSGGEIVFSAPRTVDGSNLQATLAGQVKVAGGSVNVAGGQTPTAGQVILEGFQSYQTVGLAGQPATYAPITNTSAAASTASNVYADFNTFMNQANTNILHDGAVNSLLSDVGASDLALKVRAGVELVSNGDMMVNSAWDLTSANWLPTTGAYQAGGRLALRAAGNLTVNARLGLPNETALPPVSGWSLQLAGGADTASADPLAVKASTAQGDVQGDVTISSGTPSSRVTITTSTGDIQIAAGRDFVEGSNTAVYTTGQAVTLPGFMSLPPLRYATPATGVNLIDGGSVSIAARRNIGGSNNYPGVDQWLRRTNISSQNTSSFANYPPYWWVDRAGNTLYKTTGIQGIATLGGGDIAIRADGSVSGLSVASADSRSAATSATPVAYGNNNIPSANAVYGGGDVRIDAGGNLLGGQYLVSRGTAQLSAGGVIGGMGGLADAATAPQFWLMGYSDDAALQGANMQVHALGGVTLGSVANPTMVKLIGITNLQPSNLTPGYRGLPGYFFSYSAQDSMSITSVGGDTVLTGAVPGSDPRAIEALPPRFSVVALTGSVSSGKTFNPSPLAAGAADTAAPMYQYPDSNGQYRLLAGNAIHDLVLAQSDYLPDGLVTAADQVLPRQAYPTLPTRNPTDGNPFGYLADTTSRMVAPADLEGFRYAVVAESGSLSDAAFYFPRKSVVAAGQDIANVQLDLQNLGVGDTSYVAAGRDLVYSNILGNLAQWITMPYVQIGGPGSLLVEAGRDINLGAVATGGKVDTSDSAYVNNVTRIDAVGNTKNPSLPTADATTMTIMAGVKPGLLSKDQADAFYEVLGSVGLVQDLLGQVQSNTLAPDDATAKANDVIETANRAIDTLFTGHVQAGSSPVYETEINGASQLAAAYNGALAAVNNVIAALYMDAQPHQGNITLYNARISSGTNPGGTGGTINLLAPYGNIEVGLPAASSQRNIGIFTTAGGAINGYLDGDLSVNLSKLATFQGGNILLYTSGDGSTLDAGRGSRSARTTSPPREVAELGPDGHPDGKILLLPPLDVSGSGIRTVSYDPDGAGPLQPPAPGKVYLLAPTGTIDAGEAGVSSASGLVVAALVVKNADNFSSAGASVGVPSVSSTPTAPASGDPAASASKAMDAVNQAGNAMASAKETDLSSFRPSLITVDVLGFGTEPVECEKDDDACRQRKNSGG